MSEMKQILQAVIVYAGSGFTIAATWFTDTGLNATHDVIAILVGIATFVYTILKIGEINQRMRYERTRHTTKKH